MKIVIIFIAFLTVGIVTSFLISSQCNILAHAKGFFYQNRSFISLNDFCSSQKQKIPLKGVCRPGNSCIN